MKLDIRSKVVIATAIVIVLAISLISTFSIMKSRDIILSNTMNKELPAVMGEIANSINTDLQLPISVSRVMAANPDYKKFLQDGESNPEQMSSYLKAIKDEFQAAAAFYVSDVTGNYYNHEGIFTRVSPDDPNYSWFYDIKASGKPVVVMMNIDEATRKMTLFVDYVVKINGQFKAIAGVGLSVDNVGELIKRYKVGQSGDVFLVDSSGKITVHSDTSLIGQNYFDTVGVDKSKLLTKNKYLSYEHKSGKQLSILATSYLADLDWYIVADVPDEEIFAELNNLTYSLILIGLVFAVVFLGLVTVLVSKLISPFSNITRMLEDIGKGGGDLTIRLDESRTDEVGRMAKGYNNFVEHLSDILKQVSQAGNDVLSSSQEIDQKTDQMTSELSVQTENTEQIATAIDEMGATAKEIANNAQSAAEHSKSAEDLANQGTESVIQTLNAVNQSTAKLNETTKLVTTLSDQTESIDSVLEVISDVSEQTNLLALNAAIEAARAGDQGRGFAVVADEVRKLASRSQESTEQIRTTIEQLKQQTGVVVNSINESVDLSKVSLEEANRSGEHLQQIVRNMTQVNDMNFQIASATEEQSNVVDEITPHVSAIARVSRHNSANLDETSKDCQQLKDMATTLNQLVANFKLNK